MTRVYQLPRDPGKRLQPLSVKTWSDGRVAVYATEGIPSLLNYQTTMAFRQADVTRLVDLLVVPRGSYHHQLEWYHDAGEAQRWLRVIYRRKLLRCYSAAPSFWNVHSEWLFYDELYRKETFELNQRGILITQTLIQHERNLRETKTHTP